MPATTKGRSEFLSTPSARRATFVEYWRPEDERISIHALREEGDGLSQKELAYRLDFYPRPPRGGRLAAAARSATLI